MKTTYIKKKHVKIFIVITAMFDFNRCLIRDQVASSLFVLNLAITALKRGSHIISFDYELLLCNGQILCGSHGLDDFVPLCALIFCILIESNACTITNKNTHAGTVSPL